MLLVINNLSFLVYFTLYLVCNCVVLDVVMSVLNRPLSLIKNGLMKKDAQPDSETGTVTPPTVEEEPAAGGNKEDPQQERDGQDGGASNSSDGTGGVSSSR